MNNEEPLINIPGYNPGDNITVMNVYYEKPRKLDNGKYDTDYVTIVYKDNETGKKGMCCIRSPKYRYYIKKPEFSVGLDYNAEWAPLDEVDPVVCEFRNLKIDIAKRLGLYDEYIQNIRSGNYKMNDVLCSHPRIFGSDLPILNFIRQEFAAQYKNPIVPVTKAYYDIENDIIDSVSEKPVIGECPINAISIFYDKTHTLYSFVLRNPMNPQIEKLEQDIKANFKGTEKEVNEFLKKVHGEEKAHKYGLEKLKLSVGFFDSELELIITFFNVMHQLDPDFAIAYNASYDLRYLAARLEYNGVDPKDVICDPDAPRKFYYYHVEDIDENGAFKDFQQRCDYVQCASRVTWIDQLVLYASRRKGGAATKSFKLDDIVDAECGIHKLDWSPYASRFADFCYSNFKVFWLYNLNDTIVQHCLDQQVGDIDYLFASVLQMNVSYQKSFRQTNYLISKMAEFYKKHEGVIIGININKFKPKVAKKDRDKFPGAFVADPTKLNDRNKVNTKGIYIMKFNNGDDFDYKSLYPSLIREFNMSISTMIGRIYIDKPPYAGTPSLRVGNGGNYIENLMSYNIIEFAHRWLLLPDVEEMLIKMNEYFSTMRTPLYKGEGNLPMDKTHKIVMYEADKHRPMVFIKPMPDWVKNEVNKLREMIKLS